MKHIKTAWVFAFLLGIGGISPGITADSLLVGSVLPLEGDLALHGQDLHIGLEAALKNAKVGKQSIRWVAENDFYNTNTHREKTQLLADGGIRAMIGNVGTLHARQSLPILAKADIPAIGFWSDYDVVPQVGRMINFRPGIVDELVQLLELAVRNGVKPTGLCGLAQGQGNAVYVALQRVYAQHQETKEWVALLKAITSSELSWEGRNGTGPVGVFSVDKLSMNRAYDGLKEWEQQSGHPCQFIITVGGYRFIGEAIRYFRYKNENHPFGVASTVAVPAFGRWLATEKATERVLVNSAVPPLSSDIPLLKAARAAIAPQFFNETSLEGFIIGKLFLELATRTQGELSTERVWSVVDGQIIDLDGISLDFRQREGQENLRHRTGRYEVFVNQVNENGQFVPIPSNSLPTFFQ